MDPKKKDNLTDLAEIISEEPISNTPPEPNANGDQQIQDEDGRWITLGHK